MSKYTSEVRYICENYAGLTDSVGYVSTKNVIANARAKIFDFSYPIFDEGYRSVLETKILKHFYTREIGAESVGLWKLWLDTRLNEIMPYYNQLYKSELLEFNPLYEVDLTTDHTSTGHRTYTENSNTETTGDNSTVSNGNGNADNENWNSYSDTPQGALNGIADMTYLTNATHVTEDNDTSYHDETVSESSENQKGSKNGGDDTTESYLEHVKGKTSGSSYSKLLSEYRQTFLNIDMQVINELNDLFMNLW